MTMAHSPLVTLRDFALQRLGELRDNERLIIGIAGIPGSGKTTTTDRLVSLINATRPTQLAIGVSLDGWHYARAHLDTMPDPAEAHRRRGAAFTFDGEAYATFLASVRESIRADGLSILAPSFSHELKDPTPDAIAILPHHRIVIFEGLYVLLDVEPWRRAARMLDERWIVTVTRDTARRRLIKRHVETGVAPDTEAAAIRADTSDLPNGDEILAHLIEPTRTLGFPEEKTR